MDSFVRFVLIGSPPPWHLACAGEARGIAIRDPRWHEGATKPDIYERTKHEGTS
jgi:hypothetical protein